MGITKNLSFVLFFEMMIHSDTKSINESFSNFSLKEKNRFYLGY